MTVNAVLSCGLGVDSGDGIERVYRLRRGAPLPAREHFLIAGPVVAATKVLPSFDLVEPNRSTAVAAKRNRINQEETIMQTKGHAELGRAAVDAGVNDRGSDDARTEATDAVTNILHYLSSLGEEEPADILSSAATHFFAEREKPR